MNPGIPYETVIGLEVHVQLSTRTKTFSGDPNLFGSPPNTTGSPVSLGHPGALPFLNQKAVDSAILMGLATGSGIAEQLIFSRKNYFYPDLPKGYQISQHEPPLCNGGMVRIRISGQEKHVRLIRIHLEEDAGKSIHDQHIEFSSVDLNRAGVPLIEIVSAPDLRSGEEAFLFMHKIRRLVRFLGISNGNMEEGSLRCDANVSVRPVGEEKLTTRCEIKNLNSFANVRKAIEYESDRQMKMDAAGKKIDQQTRSYNESGNRTLLLRTKEEADDYRYFPEPDLVPLQVSGNHIEKLREQMPALPDELYHVFTGQLGLNPCDAEILTEDRSTASYFREVVKETRSPKTAANWIMGPVRSILNERSIPMEKFPVHPRKIAGLIDMIERGQVSHTVAAQKILPLLTEEPGENPYEAARENNWLLENDAESILKAIHNTLDSYSDRVRKYHAGKKGLAGFFTGEVMKAGKGKFDPRKINELLMKELAKRNK